MPATTGDQLHEGIQLREQGDLVGSHRVLSALVNYLLERDGRHAFDSQVAMSQLGRTHLAQGNFTEAARLHWEVLATRAEVFGRRGSYTQNSAGILCRTLKMAQQQDLHDQVRKWMEARDDNVAGAEAPAVITELHKARVARDATAARDISNLINAFLCQPVERRTLSPALV